MSDSPFPRRLKVARLLTDISQKKLGIAAGIDPFVSSSRMNHYEKGTHHPLYDTAARIAAVLNVPTSYFYETDDTMAEIILAAWVMSDSERKRLLAKMRPKPHGPRSDDVE